MCIANIFLGLLLSIGNIGVIFTNILEILLFVLYLRKNNTLEILFGSIILVCTLDLLVDIVSDMITQVMSFTGYAELNESVTFVANDFAQAVGYIVTNDIKNGIYFLDIELSRDSKAKNGVDLAEFIKKNDENAQIIFVTAYDKYAPLTYRRN